FLTLIASKKCNLIVFLMTGAILFLVIVGVLSYAFLMAAILKARVLSPNREDNFATRFFGNK
ncbi:MAG: hypothetical protein AAFX46_12415, partial [Cyanobacteria bacterium J06636_27]